MSNDNNDTANVPLMHKALLAISEIAKKDMAAYAYATTIGETCTVKAWSRLIADICDLALEPIPAAQPDTACVAQKTEKIEQPGGIAAMQRALRSIASIAEDAFCGPERDREANYDRALSAIADTARAALAAPSDPPSNVAAIREALEEQLRYWNSHVRTREEEEMRKRTEAALSKPSRNCDRCEFWENLWGLEFVKLCPDVTDDLQRAWLFVRWLFAPSDTSKKETDNDKKD